MTTSNCSENPTTRRCFGSGTTRRSFQFLLCRIPINVLAGRETQLCRVLDQVTRPIASFAGDGAFDRDDVYGAVAERHPEAAVIVPPRSSAVLSQTAETGPTQRDEHLRLIAERGRMGWKKASGYNWRALVEADISRYKRVIGDALRSRTDARQATEVAVAVSVLNRLLQLGRPESVRIA